jgi:hypothetical protein
MSMQFVSGAPSRPSVVLPGLPYPGAGFVKSPCTIASRPPFDAGADLVTTPPSLLVGLSGARGAGKSTVAGILARDHGFVEHSFADPLKRLAALLFGFDSEALYGPSAARDAPVSEARHTRYWLSAYGTADDCAPEIMALFPETRPRIVRGTLMEVLDTLSEYGFDGTFCARLALQGLGTWGRGLDPDTWTRATKNRIAAGGAPRVVISDVRTTNEAEMIRSARGHLVWIDADERAPLDPNRPGADHSSEVTWETLSHYVTVAFDNNAPRAGLEASVARLVEWIREN